MQQLTGTDEATDQQRLLDRAARLHQERFGREAELFVTAPGRVNLIGEHTDYNDGFVFPMAIERYVALAVSVAPQGHQLTAYSGSMSESIRISLSGELTRGEPSWANYVRGVVAGFLRRGYDFPGIDLVILSSVPLGAGLSSSAALEVAVATALEQLSGRVLEPLEKALLCQAAEHEFAAVPCGLMDQLASVFSRRDHALFIDCRTRHVDFVPFDAEEVGVLVCNSNVRHSLGNSAYGTRRSECETAARALGIPTLREASLDDLARLSSELRSPYRERAKHVITENVRVQQFAAALSNADFPSAGRLMYESHESLRKDYEVSCRELDVLVDSAREIGEAGGVYGSRMTGGGFGGCTVSLVRFSQVSEITARLTRQYRERTGRELDAFVTRASEGVIRRP